MCNFLSAIILKNGDVLCAPEYTDSHEDLINHFNLRDDQFNNHLERFVRVEFVPPENHMNLADLSTWKLNVDEQETPSWFDRDKIRASLESLVKNHIISTNQKFLLGNWWILVGNTVIEVCKSVMINIMCDSSQVNIMFGSSQVKEMCDSSQVNIMYDSSQVKEMFGSSQVKEMFGSSQVNRMYDSSQVKEMFGSSQVKEMFGSSQVNRMFGSSQAPKNPVEDKRNK